MTILVSLVAAYHRLPDAPAYGYSTEKIGFCVVLNLDGSIAEVIDLRDSDKKRSPRMLEVPQAVKRTVGISPNFLWDKSSYVLGVTSQKDIAPRADDTAEAAESRLRARDKRLARVADEHATFRSRHLAWLQRSDDRGMIALLRFIDGWTVDALAPPPWLDEVLDQNIAFRLAGEQAFMHERPAAKALWAQVGVEGGSEPQTCLVTGNAAPVARLHPSIKGVWGAQSSGASLVSFNLDSFTSYGHDQGDNAPVSESAAFAYTTALNWFLDKDSGHRIQLGDASTVFWADASVAQAAAAEGFFRGYVDPKSGDEIAAKKLESQLARIRAGQRIETVAPDLKNVRFCVLGLAPNAARLSVRFWWENDFGTLTEHYQRFLSDTKIDPPPREGWPPLWRYLIELATQGKRENVPPLIAGELLRAILTGGRYPMTLFSTVLMRIRADGEINALRVAMLKSVLIRNFSREVPVALDPANINKGYILGRLFAAYEEVQRAALGGAVNATIKDKFYGAASASPQKVFRTLDAGAQNHFSKLRKASMGRAVNLEKLLFSITDLMDPSADPIPASLNSAEQALFGIGYYHQRSEFFRKHDDAPLTEISHDHA